MMSELLYEYYDRISKQEDRDVLGNWEVWIYGGDRETFPPHCHVRLPKEHLEFEVSLLTWEVINIKNRNFPNSWNSIDKATKDGFFECLNRPSKTDSSISNKKYVYYMWDSLNTENGLSKWVDRKDKDGLDKDLVSCLGWDIDYKFLSRNVIGALVEIYYQDKESRKKIA